MSNSVFLKVSLLVVMVLLCLGVSIVNAEGVALNWTPPNTYGRDLYCVHMQYGGLYGWAVGAGGALVQWYNGEWHFVQTGMQEDLFSVSASGPDEVWAVGEYGTTIHWDGHDWSFVPSPTAATLMSVHMLRWDNGWAVGYAGSIIHWNGTSWSNVTSPTAANLGSVFMVGADDGWAVGARGTIIRWDGTSWNNVTSPTPSSATLNSVFMVNADDGWAVGNVFIAYPTLKIEGIIIRWNGTDWNTWKRGGPSLRSVDMVSADDGWAVGSYHLGATPYGGAIFRWNGALWSSVTCPTAANLYSVFMVGAGDGWAVGEAVGDYATVVRWTGAEWIPEFPTAILMPLLIGLTLVAVILAKIVLKKRRSLSLPSKTQL